MTDAWRVIVETEGVTACTFVGQEQICRKMATDMVGKPFTASGIAGNGIVIGHVIRAHAERITR